MDFCFVPLMATLAAFTSCAGRIRSSTKQPRVSRFVSPPPPTTVIKMQLVDVSRADVPAVVLGEQIITASGKQVPFAFEISFDPARIESKHTYAVQARIEVDGRLWFVSDTRYPVITRGAQTHVEVVLKAVGGAAPK
jgi:putative lipoprotein